MTETITSRENAKVKQARSLRQRKSRASLGLYLVEGLHHVGAALDANTSISYILYAPAILKGGFGEKLIDLAQARNVDSFAVATNVFASIARKENPQGILAVVKQKPARLEDFTANNLRWGVALLSPQDPGNVGAILRTLDAVSADALILLDGGVDPHHPTAVRASMGSIFWRPIIQARFEFFKTWATAHAYRVYGTSAKASQDYREVEYQKPAILLMGSEQKGLTQAQAEICEEVVTLPMQGHVTSLNLAVATGVMLYEMNMN